MDVFEDIKIGLNQAIDYENKKLTAKTTTLQIAPIENFTPQEIKAIRHNTGLTQKKFALYLGVSVKTVEAWESGRNHPEGSACRLLAITKQDPAFPQKSGIVSA